MIAMLIRAYRIGWSSKTSCYTPSSFNSVADYASGQSIFRCPRRLMLGDTIVGNHLMVASCSSISRLLLKSSPSSIFGGVVSIFVGVSVKRMFSGSLANISNKLPKVAPLSTYFYAPSSINRVFGKPRVIAPLAHHAPSAVQRMVFFSHSNLQGVR